MQSGRALVGGVLLATLGLVACGSAPRPKPAPRPALAEIVDQQEPETPWSSCLFEFAPSGNPVQDVRRLGRTCGAAAAGREVGPAQERHQTAAGAVDRFRFRADPAGSCYRAYAVGGEGVKEVGLAVLAPDGRLVAVDEAEGAVAAAPASSPLCVDTAGIYEVEATVTLGGGPVAVQVWASSANGARSSSPGKGASGGAAPEPGVAEGQADR